MLKNNAKDVNIQCMNQHFKEEATMSLVVINPITRPVTYPNIKPNRYAITEYGHVIDLLFNHIINPFINSYGYLQIRLLTIDNTYCLPSISRLVAYEFCFENRDTRLQVDHLDNNKLNNHYTNLEWVTNSENVRRSYSKGYNNTANVKTELQIDMVCNLLANSNLPYNEVCRLAGLNLNPNQSKGLCSDIVQRKYWKDLSEKYDFSNRTNKFYKTTEKESNLIYSLIKNSTPIPIIYETINNKNWKDVDLKEKDRFRHRLRKYNT